MRGAANRRPENRTTEDIKSLQLEIEHIKRRECKNQERVALL